MQVTNDEKWRPMAANGSLYCVPTHTNILCTQILKMIESITHIDTLKSIFMTFSIFEYALWWHEQSKFDVKIGCAIDINLNNNQCK